MSDQDASVEPGTVPGSVDDVLAEVAHELTNPLTIARGFAEHLTGDGSLDDETVKALEAIDRNIRLALQLLATYREGTRPGDDPITLDLAWVTVAELVDATVEDVRPISAQRTVDVEHADRQVQVLVDATRIRQALFNLTANAVKHTPTDVAIHVRTWVDDGAVTVEIADDGHGVAPEVADRIFEPRMRASATSAGLGLGLYVARRIAEAHGGSLELVPAEHPGAVFHLTLPVGDDRG